MKCYDAIRASTCRVAYRVRGNQLDYCAPAWLENHEQAAWDAGFRDFEITGVSAFGLHNLVPLGRAVGDNWEPCIPRSAVDLLAELPPEQPEQPS